MRKWIAGILTAIIPGVIIYWLTIGISSQHPLEKPPEKVSPPPPPPPPHPQPTGLEKVKCKIGSDEVTIDSQGSHMLVTGGTGAGSVMDSQEKFGNVWRNKKDDSCPAFITRDRDSGGWGYQPGL